MVIDFFGISLAEFIAIGEHHGYRTTGQCLSNSILDIMCIVDTEQGALELSITASGFMIATCTGWLLAVGGTTALGKTLCLFGFLGTSD
jgi:hypothetical protein